MIVAQAAANRVGRGGWRGARRVISGIDSIRVQAELIVRGLTNAVEGKREVFALAIASSQGESGVYADVPGVEQARVERLLVGGLLGIIAERFHRGGWRFDRSAGLGCDLQLSV